MLYLHTKHFILAILHGRVGIFGETEPLFPPIAVQNPFGIKMHYLQSSGEITAFSVFFATLSPVPLLAFYSRVLANK